MKIKVMLNTVMTFASDCSIIDLMYKSDSFFSLLKREKQQINDCNDA